MLDQSHLGRVLLPVGEMTKDEVRRRARELGLRTAAKPDSQDVCFISRSGGRSEFLGARIPLRSGRMVDATGSVVGRVEAVELVTVGQRRGLGAGPGGERRYALAVDGASATVTVGSAADLVADGIGLERLTWVDGPVAMGAPVLVQASAHGRPVAAVFTGEGVRFAAPQRRVAPGQSVVLYQGDDVLGGGIAVAAGGP
jgi:tRNA-specific 2-thiouridylase